MKLSSLLNPDSIIIKESVDSLETALDILVENIVKNDDTIDKKSIYKSLEDRGFGEELILENSIAVPHGRLSEINDTIINIMVLKKPIISFGKEVRIIFLLLTSKTSTTIYLKTMATLFKISEDKALLEKLIQCQDSREFLNIIDESSVEIKKELTVKDIMNGDVISVSPDLDVKELIGLYSKHNLSYTPVVDDDNNLIGEVNLSDIIKAGIPDYAEKVGNLSFLSNLEPFESLIKNKDKVFVKGLMKEASLKITDDASIIELAVKLSQKGKRHVPVVKGNQLIGVVSLMDILMKILKEAVWI